MSNEFSKWYHPSNVEEAEQARSIGDYERAIDIVFKSLRLKKGIPTTEQIVRLSSSPEQLAIFACLSRIYVDSLKGLANSSLHPKNIHNSLSSATQYIQQVYWNPKYQKHIKPFTADHRGRQHYFSVEMVRDEVKVAQAISVLLLFPQALLAYSDRLMESTYKSLPAEHPVKELIGMEYMISMMRHVPVYSRENVLKHFNKFVEDTIDVNPERVAVIASVLTVLGEENADSTVIKRGKEVIQQLQQQGYDAESRLHAERRKSLKKRYRDEVVRILAPVMLLPSTRTKLAQSIKRK